MHKRAFLEGFLTASAVAFGGQYMWRRINRAPLALAPIINPNPSMASSTPLARADAVADPAQPTPPRAETGFEFAPIEVEKTIPQQGIPKPAPSADIKHGFNITGLNDTEVASYLRKIRNFDAIFASDIYLDRSYESLLLQTTQHLTRVEAYMGHGNFNLMSFDEMLQAGRNFPAIGRFTPEELNFLEEVFFANPHRYGFFGEKISADITDRIPRKDVAKIPRSGHFLLRGESLNLYNQIRKDVGDEVILTSGVRSNVKQMHLFLAKTIEAKGNLSRASRSLAPPGHSYHGIGDFDIGKVGFGERNFTVDFSTTSEYRKIAGLGYVDIRYPTDNLFGVRFEPWHIKLG